MVLAMVEEAEEQLVASFRTRVSSGPRKMSLVTKAIKILPRELRSSNLYKKVMEDKTIKTNHL
jgi:hypothetical protein